MFFKQASKRIALVLAFIIIAMPVFNTVSAMEASNKVTLQSVNNMKNNINIERKTFSNYEYSYSTANSKWILKRPNSSKHHKINSKSVSKTSKNTMNLNNFKKSVDNIYNLQFKLIILIAIGGLLLMLAIILARSIALNRLILTVVVLVALLFSGITYSTSTDLDRQLENAYQYYFSVKE